MVVMPAGGLLKTAMNASSVFAFAYVTRFDAEPFVPVEPWHPELAQVLVNPELKLSSEPVDVPAAGSPESSSDPQPTKDMPATQTPNNSDFIRQFFIFHLFRVKAFCKNTKV